MGFFCETRMGRRGVGLLEFPARVMPAHIRRSAAFAERGMDLCCSGEKTIACANAAPELASIDRQCCDRLDVIAAIELRRHGLIRPR